MSAVIGGTLSQAVGIAISPVAVVLVILMLLSQRGRANGIAFVVGWVAGIAIVTAAALLLADGADAATDEDTQTGIDIIHLALGILFAYLAVITWRKRPRPGAHAEESKLFSAVDSFTPMKAAGVGFAVSSIIAPKNLALEVGGGTLIAEGGLTGSADVAAIAIFTVIASLSVLIPVIAVLVMGERSQEPLDAIKEWLTANNTTIMLILFIVLGARFLGEGLGLLT